MKRTLSILALLVAVMAVAAPAMAAEDGAALYKAKCSMCHSENGVAKKMAEPSANFNDPKFQESHSVDDIAKIITDGKGKMKGFKDKLTPEQIAAIASHVKTLK